MYNHICVCVFVYVRACVPDVHACVCVHVSLYDIFICVYICIFLFWVSSRLVAIIWKKPSEGNITDRLDANNVASP